MLKSQKKKDYKSMYIDLLMENKGLKNRLTETENKNNYSDILRNSQQFLKPILDFSPAAIAICEAPDGRITYVNNAVWDFRGETDARLTDITVEEYIETWKAFHPDGRQYQGEEMPLARSLQSGELIQNEQFIVQLEDGTKKWAATWSAPIYDNSKSIIGAIAVFHDITKQKKLLNKLRDNEKHLSNLVATKNKFFSIISHDLRSPFNSVLGIGNLLESQIKSKNLEGIEEYTSLIKKSTEKAINLLDNLIEWSRSQTNTLEFTPQNIELGCVISEVIELMEYGAKQKSIEITLEASEASPVYGDLKMLKTILRNLISNGIKFTKENGVIKITLENKKSDYQITVFDNGIGIPENKVDKLFNIEESFSTPGTKKESGTGLGLILCKEFVEKHGGKIWVESDHGNGTKFRFTIPKYKVDKQ